ncbi:hypothetical protein BP5796_10905 [Coleophoma crateriformis]|uniref:BRCT domain-containing protein n=1 Tax=Coleophoma crateriformis TaxID=565419 RepID=A0A3D8QLA7_9HELO|nr:hypothetical protein BP5796_10905 [Coleophoma crateriformis]
MRLRLLVRRHSLPDTPIIWDIDTQNAAPTISVLLEEVNDVIPIESGDWGLEDYAVEIKGKDGVNFECLHFQTVAKVLHEDDEVIIRPLLTPDLRIRRLSGRHQVSTDGRHLVDGVAFGRPLLRKPIGRPQVVIPPRKRRRITYDEDEEGNELPLALEESSKESHNGQLLIEADLEDEDEEDDADFASEGEGDEDGNDEDDDDDFSSEGDGGEEDAEDENDGNTQDGNRQLILRAEFEDADDKDHTSEKKNASWQGDSNAGDLIHALESEHNDEENLAESRNVSRTAEKSDLLNDISDQVVRAKIHILDNAFPNAPLAVCRHIYDGSEGDVKKAYAALERGFKPSKSCHEVTKAFIEIHSQLPRRIGRPKRIREANRFPSQNTGPIPDSSSQGKQNSLRGLTFMIIGTLPTLSHIEVKAVIEKYGGAISTALDENTSHVILGSDVKPSKLQKVKNSKVKTINEDGLFDLIHNGSEAEVEVAGPDAAGTTKIPSVINENDTLLDFYDQNGLPKGSISSGTALSHMAAVIAKKSPSGKGSNPDRLALFSNKSVRFDIEGSKQDSKNPETLSKSDEDTSSAEDSSSADATEDETCGSDSNDSSSSSEEDSDEDSEDSSDEDVDKSSDESPSSESESDSDSSADSDSDSEPNEVSSRPQATVHSAHLSSMEGKPFVPPGKGKNSTKSRNQRRRSADALRRLKQKGILPTDTTTKEFNQLDAVNSNTSPEDALEALKAVRATLKSTVIAEGASKALTKDADFELRRKQLLDSLAAGGIDIGAEASLKPKKPAATHPTENDTGMVDIIGLQHSKQVSPAQQVGDVMDLDQDTRRLSSTSAALLQGRNSDQDESENQLIVNHTPVTSVSESIALPASSGSNEGSSGPRRRAKLDVGAGRRLLFGALGLKTPKTKKDEEKVRNDLMKYARPEKPKEKTPEPVVDADEDSDAWRSKIIYRAVECCYDGIELSEPPFPFVQRWDPQQQNPWTSKGKRGGKRKKSQRDQDQFYEDEEQVSKKQRRKNKRIQDEIQDQADMSYDLTPFEQQDDYLDSSYNASNLEESMNDHFNNGGQNAASENEDASGQISDQLMQDINNLPPNHQFTVASQSLDGDDLPKLPADMKPLSDLTPKTAKPGMVIAFKQLVMDETTQWQPQVSLYRTAVIINISDANELELTLAKRDRPESDKQYDEETGERVYGRFEMPVDEEPEQDDGYLSIPFHDLMEAKIVQPAPDSVGQDEVVDPISTAKAAGSTDESTTLGHEDFNEQDSNVPETQIHKTIENERQKDSIPEETTAAEPSTPFEDQAKRGIKTKSNILAEPLSEGTMQYVANIMREAGFRSSVPSPVLRDTRPNGPETPGIGVSLDLLLRNNTELPKESSYSPKFNGLGSSPPAAANTLGSSPISAPRRRGTITKAPAPSEESSSAFHASLGPASTDETEVRDSNDNIHYPGQSISRSLASQVSDHGRQPDFIVSNDETTMQMDDSDFSILQKYDDAASLGNEPELPELKNSMIGEAALKHASIDPDETSSDDFPTLEEVFSQSQRTSIKPEASTPRLSQVPSKINQDYEKAMASLSDADADENDGQSTPKASQLCKTKKTLPGIEDVPATWELLAGQKKTTLAGAFNDLRSVQKRGFSQSQPARRSSSQGNVQDSLKVSQSSSNSWVASSQPVTNESQSQGKRVIPKGTEIWDLTLSSDAEPELVGDTAGKANESDASDNAYFKKLHKDGSDDDDDYEESSFLSKGSVRGAKKPTTRGTRHGARQPSQSSQQQTRSARKHTSSRF